MIDTLRFSPTEEDLAGQRYLYPHYFQIQCRINFLVDRYLSLEKLHDRLQDLPIQFENPQPRPWKPINWQGIDCHQIIGIDPDVFLSVIVGAMDTEAHGLHRVATEYSATCLYIWLMAHTSGPLQEVLEELALDEINHMTKFWGFGVWAFPDSSLTQIGCTLIQTMKLNSMPNKTHSSLIYTLHRMMRVLNWKSWSLTNKATFIFTFTHAMHKLWSWSNSLTPEYLQELFGVLPLRSGKG